MELFVVVVVVVVVVETLVGVDLCPLGRSIVKPSCVKILLLPSSLVFFVAKASAHCK